MQHSCGERLEKALQGQRAPKRAPRGVGATGTWPLGGGEGWRGWDGEVQGMERFRGWRGSGDGGAQGMEEVQKMKR